MPIPYRLQAGQRLADDDALNEFLATPTWQTTTGITALAGGALTAATPVLNRGINVVSTVASGSDSVVLRKSLPGAVVIVRNASANAMQVFASGSDTINGTAGATGISVAGNKSVMFFCSAVGVWYSLLTA